MIHKIYFFKWSTFEQSTFYLSTKYKFRSAKFFPIHLLLNNKNGQGSLPLTHEKTANRIMNFFFWGGEENHFNFTRFSYIILNLYHVIQIKTWKMGDKKICWYKWRLQRRPVRRTRRRSRRRQRKWIPMSHVHFDDRNKNWLPGDRVHFRWPQRRTRQHGEHSEMECNMYPGPFLMIARNKAKMKYPCQFFMITKKIIGWLKQNWWENRFPNTLKDRRRCGWNDEIGDEFFN